MAVASSTTTHDNDDDDDADADERRPLLRDRDLSAIRRVSEEEEEDDDDEEHGLALLPQQQPVSKPSRRRSELYIVVLLGLWVLTLETGDELIQPALTRVFEIIYCRQYYASHDTPNLGNPLPLNGFNASDSNMQIPEVYCKNHVIQGQVAMLKGWFMTIEAFVCLVAAVPWGYAADVFGRRPVLIALAVSFFLRAAWIQGVCALWRVVRLEVAWAASGFALFGGGSAIATAACYIILSDVVPKERRAAAFFRLASSSAVAMVIGPFGSAILMKIDPWVPMLLGLGLQIIPIFCALALPETMNYQAKPIIAPQNLSSPLAASLKSVEEDKPRWQRLLSAARDSVTFLTSDKRLVLLMPVFALHLILLNRDILLQYISTRFSKSLSTSTFIVTFRSGLFLGFMALLFPALPTLLRSRYKFRPEHADLTLARTSALMSAAGFLLLSLAPSLTFLVFAMVVNMLGSGIHLFLRSLATGLVEPHHVARLNTFVSLFDIVGVMVGSPALAWLFERGVDLGGIWMGLPWLACSGVMAIIAVMLSMISLGEVKNEAGQMQSEREVD